MVSFELALMPAPHRAQQLRSIAQHQHVAERAAAACEVKRVAHFRLWLDRESRIRQYNRCTGLKNAKRRFSLLHARGADGPLDACAKGGNRFSNWRASC